MKNLYPHLKGRDGFTITELAIVLGIVGIIIAAIWVAAASVNEKNKTGQAVQQLHTVAQNMITLYQNRTLPPACSAGPPANMTDNAINAGIIPPSVVGPAVGGCLTAGNPWQGNFVIFQAGGNSFTVSFYDVPLDACIALLLQGTGCDPTQSGCPVSVYTAGGPATGFAPGPPPNWQNMSPAVAAGGTLCGGNAAPGAGANSVEFVFNL